VALRGGTAAQQSIGDRALRATPISARRIAQLARNANLDAQTARSCRFAVEIPKLGLRVRLRVARER
jgi:hypothetical protein